MKNAASAETAAAPVKRSPCAAVNRRIRARLPKSPADVSLAASSLVNDAPSALTPPRERFSAADIRSLRDSHPGIVVLAHPECPPEVIAEADFAGSTAAMSNYVASRQPPRVALITECSMSDNVAVDTPSVEFVRPCNLCPHMKRISLAGILNALQTGTIEVTVDPLIAARARGAVEAMLKVRSVARRRAAA